jgi:predicted Ser/Thr protein kinase
VTTNSQPGGYHPDTPHRQLLERDYEFLRELGRGGMAAVHLARHRESGRLVAIKTICAQYERDQECLQRFSREARTMSGLDHPNIVRTECVVADGDQPVAIVMEYLHGRTLRDALRTGALPITRARQVLEDVGEALAHAHACGIIHRDVKPENIFIDAETGRARLADFGIARAVDEEVELTIGGMSYGTPTYMSPEQIDGAELDARSDLYSLGVVGWEMLSGRRPWAGESLYGILDRQKHHNLPPLLEVRPDAPRSLVTALQGALRKRTGDRWTSAEEFLAVMLGQLDPRPRAPNTWAREPADSSATIRFRRPAAAAETAGMEAGGELREDTAAPPIAAALPGPRINLPPLDPFEPAEPPWEMATLGDEGEPWEPQGSGSRTSLAVLAIAALLVALVLDGRAPADAASAGDSATMLAMEGSYRGNPIGSPARSGEREHLSDVGLRSRRDSLAACDEIGMAEQRVCLYALTAEDDAQVEGLHRQLVQRHRARVSASPSRADSAGLRRRNIYHRAWRTERDIECETRIVAQEGRAWARHRADCLNAITNARAAELTAELRRLGDR